MKDDFTKYNCALSLGSFVRYLYGCICGTRYYSREGTFVAAAEIQHVFREPIDSIRLDRNLSRVGADSNPHTPLRFRGFANLIGDDRDGLGLALHIDSDAVIPGHTLYRLFSIRFRLP